MFDPRLKRLADVLVNYSVRVQPGDKVVLSAPAIAAPLARDVYAEVLRAGGFPLVLGQLPEMEEVLYREQPSHFRITDIQRQPQQMEHTLTW